ncbi:hypothetical protein Pla175_30290 [Pirellulimonas nuda]|uniref:Uncharacterized protein n=1 Tax=Pirellulimonas nuda TaxID=2528009 RepID=A0A518DDV4_9BACT|nr:hypothetical protein Pla175_30290 [Pirellulimonas nuda]
MARGCAAAANARKPTRGGAQPAATPSTMRSRFVMERPQALFKRHLESQSRGGSVRSPHGGEERTAEIRRASRPCADDASAAVASCDLRTSPRSIACSPARLLACSTARARRSSAIVPSAAASMSARSGVVTESPWRPSTSVDRRLPRWSTPPLPVVVRNVTGPVRCVARAPRQDRRGAPRQAAAGLLPGRVAVRPAGDQHQRLGREGPAANGGASDPVQVPEGHRRRVPAAFTGARQDTPGGSSARS